MSDAEFADAMQAITMARSFLAQHDWAEFDRRCGIADAAGATLDPTLYRRAMEVLPAMREAGLCAMRLVGAVGEWERKQVEARSRPC